MSKSYKVIDKEMIIDFSNSVDNKIAENAFYLLSEYIDEITLYLSATNPHVKMNNVELLMVGDYLFNTALPSSDLNLYLSVTSAQIELNSIKLLSGKWRTYRTKIVDAYRSRKRKKYERKKKKIEKKKLKEGITKQDLIELKEKPYSIISFKDDYFNKLIEKMSAFTVLYNRPNKIFLLSTQELGLKVNIFPVIHLGEDYKLYNSSTSKFEITRPKEASKNIRERNNELPNDMFLKVIRIFKSLYYNIYRNLDCKFIESLIYNLPDTLFEEEDVYSVFLKCLNYITNTDISKFKSVYDIGRTMFSAEKVLLYEVKKFLNEINKLI